MLASRGTVRIKPITSTFSGKPLRSLSLVPMRLQDLTLDQVTGLGGKQINRANLSPLEIFETETRCLSSQPPHPLFHLNTSPLPTQLSSNIDDQASRCSSSAKALQSSSCLLQLHLLPQSLLLVSCAAKVEDHSFPRCRD